MEKIYTDGELLACIGMDTSKRPVMPGMEY